MFLALIPQDLQCRLTSLCEFWIWMGLRLGFVSLKWACPEPNSSLLVLLTPQLNLFFPCSWGRRIEKFGQKGVETDKINIIKVPRRTCPIQETSGWEHRWNFLFVVNSIVTTYDKWRCLSEGKILELVHALRAGESVLRWPFETPPPHTHLKLHTYGLHLMYVLRTECIVDRDMHSQK
jgi:hypothetical protein